MTLEQSFRAGQHFRQTLVARAGNAQRTRKGLEKCFNLVVIGTAIHRLQVYVRASAARKALKEIVNKFRLQIADEAHAEFCVYDASCASAQVNRSKTESFVHRHQKISGAKN